MYLEEFKPKLVIIAGPNGSGKTSLTYKILRHNWIEGCTYINPDSIAQDMFGDWNSNESVLKAAQYSTNLREELLTNNQSMLLETVLSSDEKVNFIGRAINKGYFVRLFFVGTDSPIINASRIAKRVLNGGHDVPITKIISRYSKSIANCNIISTKVDRLYVYDNSVDNVDPILLFRMNSGKTEKIYNKINSWALNILDKN
ncbi:MAG: zeta toxin family protein [Candidatus Kapabacteria bacterium]|nr:zeta toxin family protein [Candidatus Kapabacteria bacterium]